MLTVIVALAFLVISIVVHLLICRRALQKNLKAKLFIILATVSWLMFIALAIVAQMTFIFTASFIFILLIPVYLIFYVSTELMSPSKKILQIIERNQGSTQEQILQGLQEEKFIVSRLEELVQSGCAIDQNGRYQLTSSGRNIARILDVYQRLLGMEIGG